MQCRVDVTTSKVAAGSRAWDIVQGPDGASSFTMLSDNRIGRRAPDGHTTYVFLSAGGRVVMITSGPGGNFWYTKQEPGRIGRVTPAGAVTEFPFNPSNGMAVRHRSGPDGNLWYTEIVGSRVGKITPSGAITSWQLPAGRGPAGIIAGSDGALWFAENHAVGVGLGVGALSPASGDSAQLRWQRGSVDTAGACRG